MTSYKKRSWWAIALSALLLIALALVVYRGLRSQQTTAPAAGEIVAGEGVVQRQALHVEPAPELPQSAPEVSGVLVQRQDNRLLVGTGNAAYQEGIGEDGRLQAGTRFDGPEVEVVVTANTLLYRDESEVTIQDDGTSLKREAVSPAASLEEMGALAFIRAWGSRRGDRVTATVLVFESLEQ